MKALGQLVSGGAVSESGRRRDAGTEARGCPEEVRREMRGVLYKHLHSAICIISFLSDASGTDL